ncbi:ATP-binding cassette domain-containing protein [soil metagenome]
MIELVAVSARAGSFMLHDVNLVVPARAWGIVLGPAGSGKTTLLETIAGVRSTTHGRILLHGAEVTTLPPERRGVGLVHQHAWLFPHLSVEQNIGYGTADERMVREMAARLGADTLLERPVASLSGGERQVVALARALAPSPAVLLLDEPFAALDPRRRSRVRAELLRIHRERGMTVLHVTHDFNEAGTLGDVAIVLDTGCVVQVAPPTTLFRHPSSGAVADFLGADNVLDGIIERRGGVEGSVTTLRFVGEGIVLSAVGDHPGGAGHAVIRAEDVVLSRGAAGNASMRNVLPGCVGELTLNGVLMRVSVDIGHTVIVAVVTAAAARELELEVGSAVVASIKATAVHLC